MEKPILFSQLMVKAILDGRKTKTRRPIKFSIRNESGDFLSSKYESIKHPYQPGDILWVRETWGKDASGDFVYRTNYGTTEDDSFPPSMFKWKPSIHMPREAARLFLEVTDVRVERLQEILCGDMAAEGVIPQTVTGGQWQQWQHEYFRPLWDSIYSKRGFGWEQNPWVFVIAFKRLGKGGGK